MEAVDVRGRFVWQQLMTRDVPEAKKFYSRLMGWKTQPWPPDPSYTVCLAGDVPVASLTQIAADLPAEVPAHWLGYIGTSDVEGTADAAVRAGGSIVKPPSDLQGVGRFAELKDPQGALFAIIDPENPRPEPAGTPPLGAFSWQELATSDHEAAFAFYSGLFGWDAISRTDMGPAGIYLVFGTHGVQRGGMYTKPADLPASPNWLPYSHVASVDESAGELERAGAKIQNPPMEVPGGSRITSLIDPAGAAFALHSFPAETTPAAKSKPEPKPKPKPKPKSKAKAKAKPKTTLAVRAKAAGKQAMAAGKSAMAAGKQASKSVRKAAKQAAKQAGRKVAKVVKSFKKAAKKRSAASKKSTARASTRKTKVARRKK